MRSCSLSNLTLFLGQAKYLEEMTLYFSRFNMAEDTVLLTPDSCKHLKSLNIHKDFHNSAFGPASFAAEKALESILDCSQSVLESLSLNNIPLSYLGTSSTALRGTSTLRILINLKRLELTQSHHMDVQIRDILFHSTDLEVLSLKNCTVLPASRDFPLENTTTKLRDLKIFNVEMSTSFLKAILKASPHLRSLDISYSSDYVLACLDEDVELKNLESLTIDIAQISLLTKRSLANLNLKKLVIRIKRNGHDKPYPSFDMKLIDKNTLGLLLKELEHCQSIRPIVERAQKDKNDPLLESISILNEGGRYDGFFKEEVSTYALSNIKNVDKWSVDRWGYLLVFVPPTPDRPVASTISAATATATATAVETAVSMHSTTISGTNKALENRVLSMDTKQKPAQYNLVKGFWGVKTADPNPAHYRISVYDKLEVGSKIRLTHEHTEKNEHTLELRAPKHQPYFCEQDTFEFSSKVPLAAGEQCFYGKTSIFLSSEWQPLPSLSSQEVITHVHIPGINKQDIEFQYSDRDKLYYVRIRNQPVEVEPKEIPVDYLLKTSWPIDRSAKDCSPELKKLVQKYKKNLGDPGLPKGATDDASDYKNDAEILEALHNQILIGACQHRSIAFKDAVNRAIREGKLPASTHVQVVENDCHSYIEVEQEVKGGNERICIDLGGHPAELIISNKNAPEDLARATEKVPLVSNTAALESLSDTKEQVELRKTKRSRFNTWEPKISRALNLKMYAQHILSGFSEHDPEREIKNSLVSLNSKDEIEDFRIYIQAECAHHSDKKVFYIDSPEDLWCSRKWIERVGDKGIPREGPGGPLDAFLRSKDFYDEPKKTPILVINWNNFKRQDIIKFNALYDTKGRRADGTLLPEHTRVIGLYNPNNPKTYKGDDFFRRWYFNELSKELRESLSHQMSIQAVKDFIVKKPEDFQQDTEVIDLFESDDWQEMLLGRYVFQGKELVFEEGLLKSALTKARAMHKPLEIKNGPWNKEAFRTFWQQQKLAGDLDNINGFVHSKGYNWVDLCQRADPKQTLRWERHVQPPEGNDVFTLNPTNFSKFLYDYTFRPREVGAQRGPKGIPGDLFKVKGLIEKQSLEGNRLLTVYVTQNLSIHQWAEFLETAKKNTISLDICLGPNVILPTGLERLCEKELKETVRKSYTFVPPIHITSDTNFTAKKLQQQHPGAKVINISELEQQDLLEGLTPNIEGLSYSFFRKENALLSALRDGQTVILKGKFKPELVDALSSLCIPGAYLWVNGKRVRSEELKAKILLVSEENPAFSFTKVIYENEMDILNYKAKLIKEIQTEQKGLSEWLSTRSVVQLESILRYVRETGLDPRTNWAGLISIQEGVELKSAEDSALEIKDLSLEASEHFKQARYKQIDDVLRGTRAHPFVFIAGSTGVGKSSFVQKELKKIPGSPYKVYVGLDKIQDWVANTKNADFPVLFIDEANIDAGNFSNFEGLLDKPPHMVVNGTYVELTDKHRVIFAGNPLSYGSRKTPALFEDYGGSVVFPPMSPAYVFNKVLKPILTANLGSEKEPKRISEGLQQDIGLKILSVYQYIVRLSKGTILITPRELQMMALLMMEKYKSTENLSEQGIAKIIKTIAYPLIPEKHKRGFETFCEQTLGPVEVQYQADRIIPKTANTDAFLVTASRRSMDEEITDVLALRQLKRDSKEDDLKYAAGLGGIALEGEPGVGKSEFVINLLVEKGFKEKHFNREVDKIQPIMSDISQNFFYRMPVSMEESDKEALLLRAFHEGSIVVIDEINSSSMMEHLLNALLMGYDLQGNRPINPGFSIMGTQNPISMAGREVATTALEHRFIKRYFPPYSTAEMESILQQRGLSVEDARELVEEYNDALNYAHKHHKKPAPTFGHLAEVAKWQLEAQARAKQEAFLAEEARIAASRAAADPQAQAHITRSPTVIHMQTVAGSHKKIPPPPPPPPPSSKGTPSNR